MKSNLLISVVCFLLLLVELGAARANPTRVNEWVRNQAREFGLSDGEYDELRRSGQPLVKTNQNDDGVRTSVTYVLSPDGSKISRTRLSELRLPARQESVVYRGSDNIQNWGYAPNPAPQVFRPILEPDFLARFFDNPFINPLGIGFPQFATLFPDFNPPPGVTPHVETKTITDPSGGQYTVTTSHWSTHSGSGQNPFLAPRGLDLPGFPNIGSRIYPNNPPLPPAPSFGRPSPQNPNLSNPQAVNPPSRPGGSSPPNASPNYPANREPLDDGDADEWVPVQQSTSTQRTLVPLPTLAPPKGNAPSNDRTIDDFLEKVDLTPSEIEEENGEVVRTIVDSKGRVLSARFVLSTVKGDNEPLKQTQPTK